MLAIAAGVSGCTSTGISLPGSSQEFFYPSERAAMAPAPAPASIPTPRRAAIVASAPDAVAALPVPAAEAPLPVYDDKKDPYVTAVLLPPVQSDSFPEGVDGKAAPLPPPAHLDVINLSENMSALTAANP